MEQLHERTVPVAKNSKLQIQAKTENVLGDAQMEEDRLIRLEDLPDDPLSMPPPYWRSSGAIFHVLSALESLLKHLAGLPRLIAQTDRELDGYYDKYPHE